jgi:hypothetical protein
VHQVHAIYCRGISTTKYLEGGREWLRGVKKKNKMFEYLNICVSFLVFYELFAGTGGMPLPTYINHTKNITAKSYSKFGYKIVH